MGEEQSVSEDKSRLTDEQTTLLYDKLWTAWRYAKKYTKRVGGNSPNQAKTAEYFYDSLFNPEELKETLRKEHPNATERDIAKLTTPLPSAEKRSNSPVKQAFITRFRRIITSEISFDQTYHPEAIESLKNMLDCGPVSIWTAGDTLGYAELDQSLPGSKEQLKKMAIGGLGVLKRDYKNEKNKLYVVSHEDKVSELPKIVETFRAQGVNHIVVVDDKVDNLTITRDKISSIDPEIQISLFWDLHYLDREVGYAATPRTPKGFDGTLKEAANEYDLITVKSIGEVVPKLQEIFGEAGVKNIGFVVDYDDVLTNDGIRVELQQEAVKNWLLDRGWI